MISSITKNKILSSLILIMISNISIAEKDDSYQYIQNNLSQINKNSTPIERYIPSKMLLPPKNISSEMKKEIEAPYNSPRWYGDNARTNSEWQSIIDRSTTAKLKVMPKLISELGVSVEEKYLSGVPIFEVKPNKYIESDNVIIFIHGGGYVYNPGITGASEAILMAAFTGYKVISIDYRMPPTHPYPAALDDVFSVYKAIVAKQHPNNIAIFGTSAGGGLTMALMLKAKNEKIPLPAAIGLGTPWMDLTINGGGDTINTLEWIDNTLVSAQGYIKHSALLYANGHSLEEPYISPIFGDFSDLPPTIIISGTRDLFLSQSVLTQRKLRKAGNVANLQLWDGMSHAQYGNPNVPESRQVFSEIGNFFSSYFH